MANHFAAYIVLVLLAQSNLAFGMTGFGGTPEKSCEVFFQAIQTESNVVRAGKTIPGAIVHRALLATSVQKYGNLVANSPYSRRLGGLVHNKVRSAPISSIEVNRGDRSSVGKTAKGAIADESNMHQAPAPQKSFDRLAFLLRELPWTKDALKENAISTSWKLKLSYQKYDLAELGNSVFSQDGKHLILISGPNHGPNFGRFWQTKSRKSVAQFEGLRIERGLYNSFVPAIISNNEKMIANITFDGSLQISTSDGQLTHEIDIMFESGSFSSDDRHFLAVPIRAYSNFLVEYKTDTWQMTRTYKIDRELAFGSTTVIEGRIGRYSPSKGHVLVAGRSFDVYWSPSKKITHFVSVIDQRTKSTIVNYLEHLGSVTSLSVSHDGSQALTSSLDGTVRLWDTKTGRTIQIFSSPEINAFQDAKFSPDEKSILTVSVGVKAGAGATESSKPEGAADVFAGFPRFVSRVNFWDVVSGKMINKLAEEPAAGNILNAAFVSDAQIVVFSKIQGETKLQYFVKQ
jgi:hypothetical protein